MLVIPLFAGTITKTIAFSERDFSFRKLERYDIVTLPGHGIICKPGNPLLPKKEVYFVLPPDAEIIAVRLINQVTREMPGSFSLYPAQNPIPLSANGGINFIPPNGEIYRSENPYPNQDLRYYPSGLKSGFRIVGIDIYPLHYLPVRGKIIMTSSAVIQVEYKTGVHPVIALNELQREVFSSEVSKLVLNPEDIRVFMPSIRRDPDEVNYVIITADAMVSSYRALVEWRTKQGWNAEVITTSWLYAHYSGYDNQERIRNFIKDYFLTKGLIWVVIGGDADIVPVREAYIPYHGEYYVTTDLYYSDLDETWDANNNHKYGELTGDEIDLYADVFVGRIPAANETQVSDYISKLMNYERNPPTGYIKKMLLPSVMLFPNQNYHGREVNNAIADTTPPSWLDAKIEDPNNVQVGDSLSAGFQFCHIASFGDQNGFYDAGGGTIFYINQVASLNNDSNYNILNAIASYTGDFDEYDCVGESLVNKYPGACVATILNTRQGWGSPPRMGPSELLDLKFYSFFFNHDTLEIGRCHARSKDSYRNDMLGDSAWRYCGYGLTLLGDPALPMWEEIPVGLAVTHPTSVPVGHQIITVTVTVDGSPLEHAMVCVYKAGEVHVKGYTNASGQITMEFTTFSSGLMYVSAKAKDCLPYEGTIHIQPPSYAYILYLKNLIDDQSGNNDGHLNPGESVEIPLWVENIGQQAGDSIQGFLRCSDPLVLLDDTVKFFSAILSNDSAWTGIDGYNLTLASAAANGYALRCTLFCKDNADSNWTSGFSIIVCAPELNYESYEIIGGNNNGIIDPGETANLVVTLRNTGDLDASNISSVLRTSGFGIMLNDSLGGYGDIPVDSFRDNGSNPFNITVSESIPPGTPVDFIAHMTGSDGFTADIAFELMIGTTETDFATHDAGDCRLTVTRYGAIGFMGSDQWQGLGLHYPASSSNRLYYAGFAAGNSAGYCVDRYYESTNVDDDDWNTTLVPDGMVRMYEPGPNGRDEYATAMYDDSGHPTPQDLVCEQSSWAWGDPTANDFVIMKFVLKNSGVSTLGNLSAAVFTDWDIGDYMSNQGSSEAARNLTWMYETTPYVGVEILDPPRSTVARNLAFIDHDVYVYPYGGLPDNYQIQFMDGTIQNPSSNRIYDWSTCTSAGPFTLAPGQTAVAAFAILGGNNLSDLQANADTAYNRYWNWTEINENLYRIQLADVRLAPCIAHGQPYELAYNFTAAKILRLKIYDALGRLVKKNDYGAIKGCGEINIDLKSLAAGIYFVKIEAGQETRTEKVVWLK